MSALWCTRSLRAALDSRSANRRDRFLSLASPMSALHGAARAIERGVVEQARIVLGVEAHDVAEEVMHFLDRAGAHVVATAEDGAQLEAAVRQTEPHAVVASPALATSLRSTNGSVLLALDTRESVQALRHAIGAGARGFFLWPNDRELLAEAVGRIAPSSEPAGGKHAMVIAVWAPRGGSGATFVATHLAAALARREQDTALVDMDPLFGDVSVALGAAADAEQRTMADIGPVADELSASQLQSILWTHPEGFRALLPPRDPRTAAHLDPWHLERAVSVLCSAVDTVVLDVPRGPAEGARIAFHSADLLLVVLSPDVLSFHSANRALEADLVGGAEPQFVVNRAGRSEVAPADVERVFGRPALAVLPVDPRAGQAQDRGRLLPARGRTGRAVDRLAKKLLEMQR